MLTLTNPLRIDDCTIFQDDTNDLAQVRKGRGQRRMRFYVLPETPTIKHIGGKPIFSLIVYRHDEERINPSDTTKDAGGGILTFTVEVGIPVEKFEAIRKKLRSRVFGSVTDPNLDVELDYVMFIDGNVSVAVAGEGVEGTEGEREFVRSAVGTGKVSGVGKNEKAVMVKLTQAGASLMSQIDRLRTLPINVQYELSFEHRLVGVTMNVWCDINSSYTLIQEVIHETDEFDDGYLGLSENHVRIDKITSVTEIMVRNKTAGVEVTPATSEIEDETLIQLEKAGFDMLNKEMEKAIQASPPPKEIDRTYLESFSTSAANNFNFTMDRRMVLVRKFNPSANIANIFNRSDIDDLVAFVDLRTAFFSFLKVPIRVNADFAALGLDSVVVTVTYERKRMGAGGGAREQVKDSFHFVDGATIQTFAAYANSLTDIIYDWEAVVHYKRTQETLTVSRRREKSEFLVIDVGQLGVLSVDLGLGLVDMERFPGAKVAIRYKSRQLGRTVEKEFKLSKEAESAIFAEYVGEEPVDGYEYKVDWLKKGGEIFEGPWQRTHSSRLRLDAPVTDQMEVKIACSGNFKDGTDPIAQVAVSLRYRDPANNYSEEGSFLFTAENQTQPWVVELKNREFRDYDYRYSIVYKDGLVREVPADGKWAKGEPGFLVVGEKYVLRVDLIPQLLSFPPHAMIAQVDLSYSDPVRGIQDSESFLFTADEKTKKTWRVRGDPGGPKKYTYKVTYISSTGQLNTLPPVTQDAETIILPPPPPLAAPAPPPGG